MKQLRLIEMVLLFLVLPGAYWQAREHGVKLPVIPSILFVAGFVLVLLWKDGTFRFGQLWRASWHRAEGRRIGLWFGGSALILLVGTATWEPERLFDLPTERPQIWLLVMCFYPLLSVLPQELIFRVFFFHRYAQILPNPMARVLVSALAFGWVHIAFGHWVSVVLSTIGGLFFGLTYARTFSIRLVWIEHALYGCFLFTVGLGRYFYGGAALN